jgi:nucleotide-binding universal stress UspA family protein
MMARQSAMVLVPGEVSSHGVHAAWRAALVARDLGAGVTLLHAPGGAGDAARTAQSLRQLARDIAGQAGVPVQVDEAPGDPLAAIVRAASGAALVVIGSRRGNPLRDFVLGTQAERLIRLCRVPVLVVKKPPAGGYRRVLVPVELGPAARPVIAAASRLARDPRIEVLHTLHPGDEISMRVYDVPQRVIRRLRQRAADRAQAQLQVLIAQSAAQPEAAYPAIAFGEAAAMVLARAEAMRADLLVLGKRRRGLLADFFLGSVTQRVLARARADVLVLPPARRDAGTGWSLGLAAG